MAENKFPHDSAYKAFFSNPIMVKSLLLDFVPEEFVKYFDFTTLEECSATHITPDLKQRHNDVVWRVRWRDTWCYIYILMEFQSSQDCWMPLRILTYTALLWESLIRQEAIKRGDKLPPVFPIVIYNGEKEWSAPLDISDLQLRLHGKLAQYQPRQKYFLIDEGRINREILDKATGESAHIFRLELAKTPEELADCFYKVSKLLKEPGFDILREAVNSWLSSILIKKNIVLPAWVLDNLENYPMIETTIERWRNEAIAEGVRIGEEKGMRIGEEKGMRIGEEKGMRIGEEKGMRIGEERGLEKGMLFGKAEGMTNQKTTLLEMFSDRFGTIPQCWKAVIDNINDPAVLRELTREVYRVKSVEEFGQMLDCKTGN